MNKTTDKGAITARLHAMVDERLFSCRPWQTDNESFDAMYSVFDALGLQEHIAGDEPSIRHTALGNELKLELFKVFVGLIHEYDIPGILREHGLVDEYEEQRLYELLDDNRLPGSLWEQNPMGQKTLRRRVQKAYRDYYNPSGRLN
jgi:hypothetical protein